MPTEYEKYLEIKNSKSDYEKYKDIKADTTDEQGFFANLWDFINSGAGGSEGVFTDPVGWLTNQDNPSYEEAKKSVIGGVTSGLTFGALEPYKEEVGHLGGYGAGEVVGELAPLGYLSKVIGGVQALSKVPALLRPVIAGGAIGTATGTAREVVDVAKGGEFNPEDIAIEAGTFALLDGLVGVVGAGVKKAILAKDAKGFVEAARAARESGRINFSDKQLADIAKTVKSGKAEESLLIRKLKTPDNQKKNIFKKYGLDENTAQLAANERRVVAKNVTGAPDVILDKPIVTKGEQAVLMEIKEEAPSTLKEEIKGGISKANQLVENPIRTHERLGTKEIMYDVAREVDNIATVETKQFLNDFHGFMKGKFSWWKKPEHSKKIGVYAISQQKGGKEILKGMGINEIPKLSKVEMESYKYMRDNLEKMYFDLQKARQSAGLAPFPKVENYFTFWRTVDAELNMGHNIMTMSPQNIAKKLKETPFRFKNKRVIDNYGEVNLDAFNVFEKYMSQSIRHKHLTPTLSKFNQMLEGKYFNGFSLKTQAPQAHKDLTDWVNFVGGVRKNYLPGKVSKAMGKLNENVAFAVLSYNLRSIGIQPTAIINSTAVLSPKYVKKGIAGIFNKKMRDFAMAKSNHLAAREFDVHVTEALGGIGGRFANTRKAVGRAGLAPLQWLDKETAMATWIGGYKRGKELLKLTEKEAINYADDIVIKSQASGSRVDISKLQRSDIGKLISPFQTFVINNWGFLTRDVAGIGNASITSAKAREQVMRYMAGVMATNILFEDVLQTRSPFPAPFHEFARKMEESDDEMKAFWSAMLEMGELAPVFGGGIKYGSDPLGAGVQTIKDAAGILSDPTAVLKGGYQTKKAAETFGKLTGLPGTIQAKKLGKMINED